jgi:hypothetical protein
METNIFLYIICVLIVLFNIFLIFIYIKSKFKSFPYYFNIFFCVIISINNIIRLIHRDINEHKISDICKAQAVVLTLFDKLILACVCSYSVINFLGTCKTEFYKRNEQLIFIILALFSIVVSIISTVIFISKGYSHHSEYCYADTSNHVKKVADSIITGFLFFVSMLCLIILLVNIIQLKNKYDPNESPDKISSIKFHIFRFCFDICINIILFIYILLLINKKLPFNSFVKDLIYILLCLIIEMFFTINSEFIKETKRIMTCEKFNNETEKEDDTIMITEDFGDAASAKGKGMTAMDQYN